MIKVKILGRNVNKIKIISDKIILDFENKFGISTIPLIKVRLHYTRISYDKQLGRKTYEWEVGSTSTLHNYLDIIHQESFEKYSSHPKEDFPKILKHELAHIFINEITKGKAVPMWLNEGLSMYLADQSAQYKDRGFFIEKNYLSKISTEYGWRKYSNFTAYAYACLFVEYLINKYSLDKVLILLKKLRKNYFYDTFDKVFSGIFGKSLENVEKDFIETLE